MTMVEKNIMDWVNDKDLGIKDKIKKEAKLENAKTMLRDGLSIEKILKYTGLSKKDIENLK